MRPFCIADEDTVRGLRLAGVRGEAVSTAQEAAAALARARQRPDCALLVVTEQVSTLLGPALADLRAGCDRPAVVQIPGPAGPSGAAGPGGLGRLLRSVVGAALEAEP